MSVREAADHLGVNEGRVRERLKSGDLRGEKVAGVWLVDPASLPSLPRTAGQPFSPRIAWALIDEVDGRPSAEASVSERSRLRRRWREAQDSPDPVAYLRSRLARRANRVPWHAPEPALLLQDERLVPSGRSDPRSGMAGGDFAEGYVSKADVLDLAVDHLLVPPIIGGQSEGGENVVLYVSARLPKRPVPWVLVAADLADAGPREIQQARRLLDRMARHDG